MKTIQIADQPGPGLRRLARITADGIRYRLFRSAVTLAVVATAIAFLMNMVTEGLIRRSIGTQARHELEQKRQIHVAVAHLRALPNAGTEQDILENLANGSAIPPGSHGGFDDANPSTILSLEGGVSTPPSDQEHHAELARQAAQLLAMRSIDNYSQAADIKQLFAGRLNVLPSEVTPAMTWRLLASRKDAEWLHTATAARSLTPPPQSVERLVELAAEFEMESRLTTADRLTREVGSGFLGLGTRMVWLLLVSLLVCTIGITNAMLMSVTERFREIATMKCLGALDGVIMCIFVLESCLLGLTGGMIGAGAGILIGTCRSLSELGWMFSRNLPVVELLGSVGIAMGVGLILSAIAAVYPAWQAARLAPMEAMRIQ